MALKLYNTLTRKLETFKPIKGNNVKFFVCGPTVYDLSHIGHAKTYVQFDVIVKYLRYKGYKVFYLQNITDIDDKIIARSKELKKQPLDLANEQARYYFEDIRQLNVNSVNKFAYATKYIKQIIKQVQTLIKEGYAYETSDGVYYEINKFKEYGKLSKINLAELKTGARKDITEDKKHPEDFVLWKKYKPGEPYWKSPWGNGRPGWHIEDTAITEAEFGPQYDIHGGAIDLIFPHHEAEIAQMEAASGKKPLVKYWLHTEFLNLKKEKMSKSLGNVINIRDILKKYNPMALRFLFVLNHYRTPILFDYTILDQYKNSLERLKEFVWKLKDSKKSDNLKLITKARKDLINAMDNDFDAPAAWAIIFDFIREVNKVGGGKKTLKFMMEINSIFDVLNFKEQRLSVDVDAMIKKREEARQTKDYAKADRIRDELRKKGIIIEDTPNGPRWKYAE